jgi:TonB family protein
MRLFFLLCIILISLGHTEEFSNFHNVESEKIFRKTALAENKKQKNEYINNKYIEDIANRIKSNTVLPNTEISGNPSVELSIDLNSDGNLKGEPKLIKSSGYEVFDRAVKRAIEKSTPFPPNPATGEVPKYVLITQRPKNESLEDENKKSKHQATNSHTNESVYSIAKNDSYGFIEDKNGCKVWMANPKGKTFEWYGSCEHGYAFGEGALIVFQDKKLYAEYSGTLIRGKLSGNVKAVFASGDKYEGEYKNGMREGYGTYIHGDSAKYTGNHSKGKRFGKGILVFPNGDKYIGEFNNDLPNGVGSFSFTNGVEYIGDVKDGIPEGKGVGTYPEGSKYAGDYVNGEPNGRISATFKNGDSYFGEFSNWSFHGQGVYTKANGEKLEGVFERNHLVRKTKALSELSSQKSIPEKILPENKNNQKNPSTSEYLDANKKAQMSEITKPNDAPLFTTRQKLSLLEWKCVEFNEGILIFDGANGVIRNDSQITYNIVLVEVSLFDSSGYVIDTAYANMSNLRPGDKWKFKATSFSGGKAKKCRTPKIEAY